MLQYFYTHTHTHTEREREAHTHWSKLVADWLKFANDVTRQDDVIPDQNSQFGSWQQSFWLQFHLSLRWKTMYATLNIKVLNIYIYGGLICTRPHIPCRHFVAWHTLFTHTSTYYTRQSAHHPYYYFLHFAFFPHHFFFTRCTSTHSYNHKRLFSSAI